MSSSGPSNDRHDDVAATTGFGVSVYLGRGWVFHWSTEEGFQRERAEHQTLRLGVVMAVRRV